MIPTKKQCIEQNISNKRIKQKMAKFGNTSKDCWLFIYLREIQLDLTKTTTIRQKTS